MFSSINADYKRIGEIGGEQEKNFMEKENR